MRVVGNPAIFSATRSAYFRAGPARVHFRNQLNNIVHLFQPNATGILLQAVVERVDKVTDGDVIIAIRPAWEQIVSILQSDPTLAFKIDARKWEELIAAAYEKAGFDQVILTPRSGDLGRDVIAVKRGLWTVRIIDQVKAYAPGNLVPANDVRALLGVLQADPNATKGVLTTTSGFAPKIESDKLLAPFMPHRLQLIDGTQLLQHLGDIAKGKSI